MYACFTHAVGAQDGLVHVQYILVLWMMEIPNCVLLRTEK